MNSRQHAEHSAKIFGGSAKDYLAFHECVDANKTVSASVYGRFFLHHIDIGLLVIEKTFQKKALRNSRSERVSYRKLLLQHLVEDYSEVPTFEKWLNAFSSGDLRKIPHAAEGAEVLHKSFAKDPILKKLSLENVKTIEGIVGLGMFTDNPDILLCPQRYCIFGHVTGMRLLETILGEMIAEQWTSDVLVRYYDKKFGGVPTLLDWEPFIARKDWMHAPEGYDRQDIAETKKKMDAYLSAEKLIHKKDILLDEGSLEIRLKRMKKIKFTGVWEPGRHRGCGGGNNRGFPSAFQVMD